MTRDGSANTPEAQLKTIFGFDGFRNGQKPVINTLVNGRSALAIFPTGSGKSLCYQFTATQLPNLTLVVSPLLALIKDQLEFLQQKGIAAASLDSTLTFEEYNRVVKAVRDNTLKVLMVSVERFKNERFRILLENTPISLLVVDEAHCISEWGHNFRPDYLKLPNYRNHYKIPQTLLLTATATRQVKQDMAAKFDINDNAIVQTGFYRPNLHLNVLPVAEEKKLSFLADLIRQQGNSCGIVYVTLQNTAQRVASYLTKVGINAKAYHAGMDNEPRQQVQDEFMRGDTPVVVATIAFGMGVDKPNIRFVVHYDLPKSIENYSQEIGRAGRDGKQSQCWVLGNLATLNTIENFVYGDTPELWGVEAVIHTIKNREASDWETQITGLSNLSNIRQLTLKTLLVKLEMRGVITPKYSYSADYKVKLLIEQNGIIEHFRDERRAFVTALFNSIQFKKVWGSIDFDQLYNTYGGERKRAITALEYMAEQGWLVLKPTGNIDVYAVNDTQLNTPGLAQSLFEEFQQHEASEIQRIGLMLRFLQSKNCLSYGLAKYFDDQQAPQQCGHCSVCEGKPARLPTVANLPDISTEQLQQVADKLRAHLSGAGVEQCSNGLIARFLVGISVPVFTKTKAKQSVAGFALAEALRYDDIIRQLSSN